VPNPFRRALLAGTVGNTPDAHKLAAKVERTGGWPVMIAIDAAKQAGKDWRPAVAEARHRMAQDALHRQALCTLCVQSAANLGWCDGRVSEA
jgi:hypothetical protein